MKFVIATILLTIIVVKADPQVSGTDATDITTGLTGAVAGLQSLGQAILDLVKQFPVLIDVFVKLVEIIRDVIPYLPKIVEAVIELAESIDSIAKIFKLLGGVADIVQPVVDTAGGILSG